MRVAWSFQLRAAIWLCFVLASANSQAQDPLWLERVEAPGKHRRFKVGYYHIQMSDTVVFRKVTGHNRSMLFLEHQVHHGDSLVSYPQNGGKPDKTVRLPRYRTVSSELPIDQVLFLKMGRTGRSSVNEPFALVGWTGALVVLGSAPFVIASNDSESKETWAAGAAVSGGFIAAAFLLNELVSKPEERNEWRIVQAR